MAHKQPTHWGAMFCAAKEFYERHGHLNVPADLSVDGENLSRWVQKIGDRRHTLSPDRMRKLEQLGIAWGKNEIYRQERWYCGYRHARAFYKRNGHLRVPEKHIESDGYTLGRWIRAQRVHYKNSTIDEPFVRKLEQIGMLWRVDQRVQTSFNEQAIFYYVKGLFPDAENRNRDKCGCELDIFIPSIGLAVEYDSLPFHGADQLHKDIRKNKACAKARIVLIRIRHCSCPPLGKNSPFFHCIPFYHHNDITESIRELLAFFHRGYGADISNISVDIGRDYAAISEQMANLVDAAWAKKLADAKAFWLRHHHLDIPYGYMTNGYNLGSWLQEQRKAYAKNQLLPYKIKALEALGIKWFYLDETWQSYYQKVKQHYEQHGNTNFKLTDASEKSLFYWKSDQLKLLRKNRMPAERTKQLAEIGIQAEYAADQNFMKMCGYLQRFCEENGHSVVPIDYRCSDGTRLGGWLQRQRALFQKGQLPLKRLQMLQALDFCPHNYAIRFDHWLELLANYRREHGHICVPQAYTVQGQKLGKFINKMRVDYRRGKLLPARIKALEALGMVWYITPGSKDKCMQRTEHS